MQAMILDEDTTLRTDVAAALASVEFDVQSFSRPASAKAALRQAAPDLLVLGESVEGRLTHDVALLAEWRHPGVGAILLSDRKGEGIDDLFELIPSLQFVLGRCTGARAVAQAALSALRSQPARPDVSETPEDPLEDDLPGAGGPTPPGPAIPAVTTSAPATLSPAETRRLLAELGRRYARLIEDSAATPDPGDAPRKAATTPQPLVPLRRPARASLSAAADPAPSALPVAPAPGAVAPAGRRLHLA